MSLWVPVVALLVGPMLVWMAGERIGMDPFPAAQLAIIAGTGPGLVLTLHAVRAWGLAPGWSSLLWVQWALLVGPGAAFALIMRVLARRPASPPPSPVSQCARCGAELYPDRTGRRYLSMPGSYLCPPAQRAPGDRRHRVTPAAGQIVLRDSPRV